VNPLVPGSSPGGPTISKAVKSRQKLEEDRKIFKREVDKIKRNL
jgi:hypothetical protein